MRAQRRKRQSRPVEGAALELERVRIGISACLLGHQVRYDGGHKRDPAVLDAFEPHVEWVAVCPEVEAGMATPREPLRLERVGRTVRMLTVVSRVDHTDAMHAWSARRLADLAAADLDGYILKSKSPSCGLDGVAVFDDAGQPAGARMGLFAEALVAAMPFLPVEDEVRLHDPAAQRTFLDRVRAYHRSKGNSARRQRL